MVNGGWELGSLENPCIDRFPLGALNSMLLWATDQSINLLWDQCGVSQFWRLLQEVALCCWLLHVKPGLLSRSGSASRYRHRAMHRSGFPVPHFLPRLDSSLLAPSRRTALRRTLRAIASALTYVQLGFFFFTACCGHDFLFPNFFTCN